MSNPYYITSTLPYVNADPHIGFALEMVQADTITRLKRLQGFDVVFNTGTDEHGLKIYQKAQEQGVEPLAYCDTYAKRFESLKEALNLSYTHFIRTTNPEHKKAAQEFWKRCAEYGYIDKKLYNIKYCIGCELEKTDSELEDGVCPLHPKMKLQTYEEENYFFKFSAFQERLLKLYDENPLFVQPDFRLQEIRNFVSGGLEDFSISRLKKKMPWGIPVPGDDDHVMYVWFDALINYISTLGWPHDTENFSRYWPGVQIAGKDNLRQQSAMWQAMLMAAGLPASKEIIIHGFITSEGQKMSKSLGNVVNPYDLVKEFGTDAVRYYLLREIPTFNDGDFSTSRFHELYNADLANGLGNLVARVARLAENNQFEMEQPATVSTEVVRKVERYQFSHALADIWDRINACDVEINKVEPWKLPEGDEKQAFLTKQIHQILQIAFDLRPFMPNTADNIEKAFSNSVTKPEALFPRLSKV